MKACRVPGCTLTHYGLNLCQKHYARRRRMGVDRFERLGVYNTPEEKFWLRVNKSGKCWIWTLPLSDDGYGVFTAYGKTWKAHRFALAMSGSDFNPAMDVDHRCHNRACVRPDHLRPVTNKQNAENRAGAVPSRSKTGIRGVYPDKESGKYRVAVGHHGRIYHGGYFTSLDRASVAAQDLRNKLFTHNDDDHIQKVATPC